MPSLSLWVVPAVPPACRPLPPVASSSSKACLPQMSQQACKAQGIQRVRALPACNAPRCCDTIATQEAALFKHTRSVKTCQALLQRLAALPAAGARCPAARRRAAHRRLRRGRASAPLFAHAAAGTRAARLMRHPPLLQPLACQASAAGAHTPSPAAARRRSRSATRLSRAASWVGSSARKASTWLRSASWAQMAASSALTAASSTASPRLLLIWPSWLAS